MTGCCCAGIVQVPLSWLLWDDVSASMLPVEGLRVEDPAAVETRGFHFLTPTQKRQQRNSIVQNVLMLI